MGFVAREFDDFVLLFWTLEGTFFVLFSISHLEISKKFHLFRDVNTFLVQRKEKNFKQKTDQTRFPRTKRSKTRSRRIFESFSTNSLSISRSQFPLFRERGNKIKGEEEGVIKGEEECVTQRTSEDGDAGNYATAAPTTPTTKWDDDNSDQWNECRYGSSVGTSVQRCDEIGRASCRERV